MGQRRCDLGVHRQARELHGFPFAVHRHGEGGGNSGALRDWVSAAGGSPCRNDCWISLVGGVLCRAVWLDSGGCLRGLEASGEKELLFRGARRCAATLRRRWPRELGRLGVGGPGRIGGRERGRWSRTK